MNFILSFYLFYPFLMIGVVAIAGITQIKGKNSQSYQLTCWDLLMALLAIFVMINTCWLSPYPFSFLDIILPVFYTVLYLLTRLFLPLSYSGATRVVVILILLMGFIEVVIGEGQALNILHNSLTQFKVGGSFGNPGIYAMFLLTVLTFSIYVFVDQRKSRTVESYAGLALSVMIAYVLFIHTDSRTGWMTLCVIVAGYILAYRKMPRFVFPGLLISGLLLFIILLKYKQQSTDGRYFVMSNSIELLAHHPLWGIGTGNFDKYYNDQQAAYFSQNKDSVNEGRASYIVVSYNEFLQFLVEGGLIALIILFAILIKFAQFIRYGIRNEADNMHKLLVISAIAFALIGMTSYPFRMTATLTHFVLILGLIGTADKQSIVQFNVKKIYLQGFTIIICLFIAVKTFVLAESSSRWQTIADYLIVDNKKATPGEVKSLYAKLSGDLGTDPTFLQDYGEKLYRSGDYPSAIQVFQQAVRRSGNYDIYESMGASYEEVGNLKEAARAFLKSNYLVPKRFYPKYKLMLIYLKVHQTAEALKWAHIIVQTSPKVDGAEVQKMKRLAQQVIDMHAK